MNGRVTALREWYSTKGRPFFEEHLFSRVADFDAAIGRIEAHEDRVAEELAVCFLGDAGIGKSTLINALVAGEEIILPAGGIGPLTAQAMEVRFGEDPAFEAEYHPPARLWQGVIFGLERGHEKQLSESTGKAIDKNIPPDVLAMSEEPDDGLVPLDQTEPTSAFSKLESLKKQAQLLVKGNQDVPADLPYLLDCLREAAGKGRSWGTSVLEEDRERVARLGIALAMGRDKRPYTRDRDTDEKKFRTELSEHASGFLAPVIRTLRVRWPAPVLSNRMLLVDLPGVGIAGDVYKEVTREWITKRAKAVVLVVGRSGLTEATADLLRSSDYLTRLLFSRDDRNQDPVVLILAMTHVDDIADTEWVKDKSRKRAVHLAEQFQLAKERLRLQLHQELNRVWESGDEQVRSAQREVIESLAAETLVFPVSAPQFRRVLAQDDDDRPFISSLEESGIPALKEGLQSVVTQRRRDAAKARDEALTAFASQAKAQIELIRAKWTTGGRTNSEIEQLSKELDVFLTPLRKEFLVRQGSFREFLKSTMPERIDALVGKAKESARREIVRYLSTLSDAHWATLRAAVRREGTFYGSRHINLPDDFARKFVEPVAEVWGKSIIQDIRKRTKEFAGDAERLVEQLAEWCRAQGARVPPKLLDAQIESIHAEIRQIDAAGKDIIESLREQVKNELGKTIQKPIQRRCRQFVANNEDVGAGVKRRILELFDKLASDTTDDAAAAAKDLLLAHFKDVQAELRHILKDLEDPLQSAADVITETHRGRLEKADAKDRERVLAAAEQVLACLPPDAAEGSVETASV